MNYYLKKLVTLIITLFLVSVLAFLAFQVISDPATAILGTEATDEAVTALRHEMGLDRPVVLQYWSWLSSFLRGDFGVSYNYSLPVGSMISEKLALTAGIALLSFLLLVLLSIPLGVVSAWYAGGIVDQLLTVLGQVCMSVPAFLLGVALTYVFGISLRVFTPGSYVPFSQTPWHWFLCLIFPALSVALARVSMTAKMLRSSILEQADKNYVLTSYSRGAASGDIMRRHLIRNAILPTITFIGSSMTEIVASCIIVEQVFALPGLGVLLLSSIGNRDFPVVLAIVMILATWVIVINFIADMLCQLADPRVRLQ